MKQQYTNDQVTSAETAEILHLAESCLSVSGDFVELGCYRGDTSVLLGKLLAKNAPHLSQNQHSCGKPAKNSHDPVQNLCIKSNNQCKTCAKLDNPCAQPVEKHLWIYDSFAGLPEKTSEDRSGAGVHFQAGELFVTKREVIDKLRRNGLRQVIVKKAWFDDLIDQDLPEEIAFAFLDGDLYDSIKTSLQLVVPRLNKQGIIVVHDYNNPELPGSARAVDEFLRAHPNYQLQVRHTLAILSAKR